MDKTKRYIQLDEDLKKIKKYKEFDASRKERDKKDNFLLAFSYNIGYYLVTPLIVGVLFGVLLDNKFHTKPVLTLVFIFLGMVASLYNLLRITKESK